MGCSRGDRASGDPTAGGGAGHGGSRIDRVDRRRESRPREMAICRPRQPLRWFRARARLATRPPPAVRIETVTVTQLSPDTVLAPLPDRDGRGFALRAGGARFSVPHDTRRPFVVAAGDVTIEDLGTTFTVRYLAADRLNIAVEEGRVRVRASGSDTEVPAGATLEVPVSPLAEAAPRKQQRPAGTVASSWRPLAERGQYEEAQKALRKAGPSAVRDDTADLLLAADAARLSGHPAEAVPYLERVLRGHTRDPRAGLAAFTLGRVLLDELGRPSEAVEAFALCSVFRRAARGGCPGARGGGRFARRRRHPQPRAGAALSATLSERATRKGRVEIRRARLTARRIASVLALAAGMHTASAQGTPGLERPRVSINIVGCDAALAREAQRIAAIELRATLVDPAPDATVTQVTAACRNTLAALEVIDPTTGKSLERSVALTEAAPNGRARLLALAVAELVVASWSELQSNPQPRAPPATPLAPYAAREAARAAVADRSLELAATFDVHVLASGDCLFGGGARAAVSISPLFFARFDVLADYAEVGRATGSVAVIMPSVSAALGVSRWIGASLRPAISVGLRGGYVRMNGIADGTAATGSHQQGVWLGPEVALQVSAWPRARVHPILGVSAGAHLLGVRGTVNDGRDVEAVGIWGGVSAAVAVR